MEGPRHNSQIVRKKVLDWLLIDRGLKWRTTGGRCNTKSRKTGGKEEDCFLD